MQKTFRFLVFIVFFAAGAGAVSLSMLSGEIMTYYKNKDLLSEARNRLVKLEHLNEDYDFLLQQVKTDPNLLKRVGSVTLARFPNEPNTVTPKTPPEQLARIKSVLKKMENADNYQVKPPDWLKRVNEPRKRLALFLAGTFLIIVSLVFFNLLSPDKEATHPLTEDLE